MRLSVFIYDKLCSNILNDTFVIFLNKFYQLMNNTEEFFVKKSIKKFITFKIFSFICESLTFRSHVLELLNRKFHGRYRSNIRSFKWYDFVTLAFNDMVLSKRDYFIAFLNSRFIIDFLSDNFPFVIKCVLIVSILGYEINKLWQWHAENFVIKCDYFNNFFIFCSFHQQRLLARFLFFYWYEFSS